MDLESIELKRQKFLDILNVYHKNLNAVSAEDRNGKYKKAFSKKYNELVVAMLDYIICNMCYFVIPEGKEELFSVALKMTLEMKEQLNTFVKENKPEEIETLAEQLRVLFFDSFFNETVADNAALSQPPPESSKEGNQKGAA